MITLHVDCEVDDEDFAELEQLNGSLYLKVVEGRESGVIRLTPETAEQLRDALTEWLEAQ